MSVWFWSSVERSELEADMGESWVAAESIGVNETAQRKEEREVKGRRQGRERGVHETMEMAQ